MKAWVGLTYLICRILDTVEDAPWKDSKVQQDHFDRFNGFLESSPSEEELELWSAQFPDDIPVGEKLLLRDSHQLFADLHAAPEAVKAIIQQMVKSMSLGMKHFSEIKSMNHGVLKLNSLNEVNQYCFFVAGVVGEALARLVNHVDSQFQLAPHKVLDAHHFGLFLQKVNLLKDHLNDAAEGREFIFNREQIYKSMSLNVHGAWRFFNSVPLRQREFRLFCAWSLFLGLASLPWLEQFNELETSGKLPRNEAEEIFAGVKSVVDHPGQLKDLYVHLILAADLVLLTDKEYLEKTPVSKSGFWPSNLYQGNLESVQVSSLGF